MMISGEIRGEDVGFDNAQWQRFFHRPLNLRANIMIILFFSANIGNLLMPHVYQDSEISILIKTINDNPDLLHKESTPSVNKLIEKGVPSIPHVLKLMRSESGKTRLRAQKVLEGILLQKYGFIVGKGWKHPGAEKEFLLMWRNLGSMNWKSSIEERNKSIDLWENWLIRINK